MNSPTHLKILQLNVRGINKIDKFNKLRLLFDKLSSELDVIVLSETKLKINFPLALYSLPGFQCFTCTRLAQNGGGVLVFVRSGISAVSVQLQQVSFERIHLQISIGSLHFRLICIYRAPDPNNFDEFISSLEDDLRDCETKTIIAGDINVSVPNLTVRPFLSNGTSRSYCDLLESFGYEILNIHPTRPDSGKTIDHVVTNFANSISVRNDTIEIDNDITDHCAILSTFEINLNVPRHTAAVSRQRINFETLNDNFSNNLDGLESSCTIAETLTHALQNAISLSTSTQTFKVKHVERISEWTSAQSLELLSEKDRILRKRRKKPRNPKIQRELMEISEQLNNSIRADYSRHIAKNVANRNPKMMWKGLNKILGRERSNNTIVITDPTTNAKTDDPAIVAELFNKHFTDCFQPKPQASECFASQFVENASKTSLALILPDESEVSGEISRLKNNCAVGHDGISTEVIKKLSNKLVPMLLLLISAIFSSGIYPTIFKKAVVVPIFKSGSRLAIENYRPISVLPVLNKIIERIIFKRLSQFFHHHQKFTFTHQFGFREKCSTENAAVELCADVIRSLDKKQYATAVFLDLKKAFDSVQHEILLDVIQKYGVRGLAYDIIRSYLSGRKQTVKVGDVFSSESIIASGVVQGSCLGPLLFIIFINALGALFRNGKLFLFADDAVLVNHHTDPDPTSIAGKIRSAMSPILKFFLERRLELNYNKSNFMVFSPSHIHINLSDVDLGTGLIIRRTQAVKYLGLVINEKLEWSDHVNHLLKKLSPASGILWKLRNKLPLHAKKTVYDALFQSHLNFMSLTWSFSPWNKLSEIQVLQNRALRNVYQLDPRSNRVQMYLHQVESHLPLRGICLLNAATFLYKATHNATVTNFTFKKSSDVHQRNLRNSSALRPLPCRSRLGNQSLEVLGPKIYNRIPSPIKDLKTPGSFRWALRIHLRNENFIKSCFDHSFFDFNLS
jgi:hypothetical protein